MHYSWLPVLALFCTATPADSATTRASLWDDIQVMHQWSAVPKKWESLGHPPAGTTIDLHIALEPHRENALIDALYQVSDPSHPKYGAHLSREQVAELVAPHPHSLELVYSWLEHGGVSSSISTTHGGGWLTVTKVPVSQANDLLGASYQLYRHTGTNKTLLRTVGYGLPAVLHGHVQTVAPTTYFSSRTLHQTPRERFREEEMEDAKVTSGELVPRGPRRSKEVTLESLRSLYKTVTYVPVATGRNKLGIASYGESANQEDLTAFMNIYRTDAQDATFTVVKINDGKYDSSNPGKEASLNIQYAEGMAYPTPHVFYSIGGSHKWFDDFEPAPGDADFEWLKYLLSLDHSDLPQTISISYGFEEHQLPKPYATSLCNLFGVLGARGVSILAASGDFGVGVEDDWDCKDNTGQLNFVAVFPASCPYVTSVGGTRSVRPEVAASFSGGGFSYHFRSPKYQKGAVSTYLKYLDTDHKGYYNPDGRGYPDISAQAVGFKFIVGGRTTRRGEGTSYSAPIVAGIISLLNDYLLSKGEASLGFLNPWLYGLGRPGLIDIISGSNPGCYTEGFSAIDGWDPVTGLGTPDFMKLLGIRASLIPVAPGSSTPTST